MAEQQTEQVWRVVTHARNGAGWWTVAPCAACGVRRLACGGATLVQATASATGRTPHAKERTPKGEGGCSNAGVYPERHGKVELPGWIKVREGAGM